VKTLAQLQQDVVKTRNAVDAALLLVPAVPYSQCGGTGRKAYDDLSFALSQHRNAVAIWRVVKQSQKETTRRLLAAYRALTKEAA
jgi:hypothetical protein